MKLNARCALPVYPVLKNEKSNGSDKKRADCRNSCEIAFACRKIQKHTMKFKELSSAPKNLQTPIKRLVSRRSLLEALDTRLPDPCARLSYNQLYFKNI